MSTKKLSAAVVGCGMGGHLSMTGLAGSEHFDLVAAADVNAAAREKTAAKYPGLRLFASHEEMFLACPTDIVCISTWAPSHQEITLQALAIPGLKGLLVEKPLGSLAAQGKKIVDAVRDRNLPMVVPHGLLVARHTAEIIDLVRGGAIGTLKLVEIQNSGWDIINAGIHWLNFCAVLTYGDTPAWVLSACDSTTRTWRDGMQVETLGVTYVQTRSGVRFVMNTGDEVKVNAEGRKTVFRLIGSAGVLEFWGWSSEYRLTNAENPKGRLVQVTPNTRTNHGVHLDNLASQIREHHPDYKVAESSLTALELCEGAYLSATHRCMVTFPFDEFRVPAPNDWKLGMPYSGTGGGRDGRQFG